MKISVIAQTQIMPAAQQYLNQTTESDADYLFEFAGRACYQSWNRPNPKTANNTDYIANVIRNEHFSVAEHASVTFYVEGVSRNMTHELIRHRHLSYSELSQRFVNMEDANFVSPPASREIGMPDLAPIDRSEGEIYADMVKIFEGKGKTRKEAREAARFYLPSGMETRIVVTGNHRAWRDMLHKRYSVHADAEIREFATLVLAELRKIAPATYQDFPDEPFA